ncbi:MAG: sensor histidine kinase, partial [Microthrixaceae bacterium]
LVSSLLLATSIDQRGLEVITEQLDWLTIVEQQAELYRRTAPTHAIEVTIAPGAEEVAADRHLASGVIANLLSNALKYSPDGSTIEVEAALERDRVVTSVSDNGPGVPAGDRERIFDKFTRLGDHLTRPQQGVGLGLFIARRSLEQMNGAIWCDESSTGGARFAFTLPVSAEAAQRRSTGRRARRRVSSR